MEHLKARIATAKVAELHSIKVNIMTSLASPEDKESIINLIDLRLKPKDSSHFKVEHGEINPNELGQ